MSCKIIIDHEKSKTTTREVPVFSWVRFDAEKFIFEEALLEGNYLSMYYSGMGRGESREMLYDKYCGADKGLEARYKRNHLMSFILEIDGQLLKDGWQWERDSVVEAVDGGKESIIQLAHDRIPVEVKIHTLLDGTSFAERWLEITNKSGEKAAISSLSPWCGMVFNDEMFTGITRMEQIEFSLGHYKNSNWCMEGEFVWDKIHEGTWKIETDKMIKFGPAFYILRNDDTGEMMVIDFEHTGGVSVEFTNSNNFYFRQRLPWRGNYLYAKIGLAGSSPLRVLEPGETVASPRVHFAMLYGDLDNCVNQLYRHLRKSVISYAYDGIRHPLAYNYAGYSACVQTTADIVRSEVESAAALGAELFMVDAGWFGARERSYSEVFGDWFETPGLENRLKDCFDYARQKGMKCGLWVAIEILGLRSEFAAQHKEWFIKDGGREIRMLDITKPEVAEYVFETISGIIDRYQLDCFRIDGGYDHLSSLSRVNGKYVEDILWLYCEKLQEIFARIKKKHPGLILENCWGGGGRTDLGMMRRFHWTQLSDNQHPEEQLRILNGLSLAIPPEQCMLFIAASHPQQIDVDFLVRVGLFCQTCMVGVFPALDKTNEAALENWKHMIDLYKNEIRPMLSTCRVYHHTPIQDYKGSGEWVVLEYVDEKSDFAMVGLFRLEKSTNDLYHFRSRGLSLSKEYRVWHDNYKESIVVSGRALCQEGVTIRVPGNMQSELLIIRNVIE